MSRTRSIRRALAAAALLATVGVNVCGPGETAQAQAIDEPEPYETAAPAARAEPQDTAWARSLSSAFRMAANHTLPSVVYVAVERSTMVDRQGGDPQIPDFFRRFFDFQTPEEGFTPPPQTGSGSGFVIDEDGHILTNNHVVANADVILVRTHDGREFDAEVVGTDPSTDIAVLRIDAAAALPPPVTFGDSDEVLVGDWVLALGNPLGLEFTVTSGIVSAKGRQLTTRQSSVESFIQTDAAINPGNSGGPLIDLSGRVIGVNTAIFGGQRFVGYGFAVPIDLANEVVRDILEYGYARRPRLGIGVSPVTAVDAEAYGLDEVRGAEVVTVDPEGPAAGALAVGDVVLAVNGRDILDANALIADLARRDPGDEVTLTVVRDGREREVTIELDEFEHGEAAERVASGGDTSESLLGLRAERLTPELAARFGQEGESGVVVTAVQRYGAAARAGVRPGQIIRRVNGQEVVTPAELRRITDELEDGEVVSLRVVDPEVGETIINFRVRAR